MPTTDYLAEDLASSRLPNGHLDVNAGLNLPGPPGISLPLGPRGGASYAPSVGVLGAEQTSRLKGTTMRVESYIELLNLT
ncbi:hypothetical protein [Frankia tisae]|uniref:hypothetical protein n=1 Tax=Frankia tisae TaxID=2950104 RepID=UPI0021BF93F1|nr:hypothetical protein [Frankia tisae]